MKMNKKMEMMSGSAVVNVGSLVVLWAYRTGSHQKHTSFKSSNTTNLTDKLQYKFGNDDF